MSLPKPPPPKLLGVHLEIHLLSDPQRLMKAFGQEAFAFRVRKGKERHRIRFDLPVSTSDADTAILRFSSLVHGLPADQRRLWDEATSREFHINVGAPPKPFSHEFVIGAESVKAAAELRADIVFTMLAPGRELAAKKGKKTG